jgi:uncharacterized protein YidB (DUF937 family)
MGLLDEVMSMAGHCGVSPDQHASVMSAVVNYVNSPQVGGIAGLEKMFQQGGLGSVFSSWIGNGQSQPVSNDQLQNVLHSGALEAAAQKAGIDPATLSSAMSCILPHLVDKLSPNGQMPDASSVMGMLKGLAAGHSASA